MSPRLYRLGPEDWERQRALRLTALAADPDAFYRSLAEEQDLPESRWRERLSGPAATWVAVVGGADVGLVACLTDSHEGLPELVSLWVSPSARGQGVGAGLAGAAADFARSTGAAELRLWLADSNAAGLALYDRLGAPPTGRTGHFPPPREHLTEHERSLAL